MKTYIITGASSDVGLALIERLVAHGEQIAIHAQYHSTDTAIRAVAGDGIELHTYRADLIDVAELAALVGAIRDNLAGAPTHIVHLAAPPFSYMRARKIDLARLDAAYSVGARTFGALLKAFLPVMIKAKFGRIAVMLTAYTVGTPPRFMADYVMGKYALLGLVKAVAPECAAANVTINALSPNLMQTKFLAALDERQIEMAVTGSARGRAVEVAETVSALEYLLADGSGATTGLNMVLGGGDYM